MTDAQRYVRTPVEWCWIIRRGFDDPERPPLYWVVGASWSSDPADATVFRREEYGFAHVVESRGMRCVGYDPRAVIDVVPLEGASLVAKPGPVR